MFSLVSRKFLAMRNIALYSVCNFYFVSFHLRIIVELAVWNYVPKLSQPRGFFSRYQSLPKKYFWNSKPPLGAFTSVTLVCFCRYKGSMKKKIVYLSCSIILAAVKNWAKKYRLWLIMARVQYTILKIMFPTHKLDRYKFN